jgi:O-antigen ligase
VDRFSMTPRVARWATGMLVFTLVVWWSGAPRDAFAWGGVVLTLFSAAHRPFALRDNPALVLLLLFVAWALVGTLWAPQPSLAFRDWIKLATLAAFAWSAAQLMATRDRVEHVLLCLCVSLTVVYVVEVALWLRTVGATWHFGDRVMEPFSFQHINTFAGMIVASFALGWLLVSSDWKWRRTVVAVQVATGLLLLWLFASRTAQLSFVALVIVALAAQRRPAMRMLAVLALVACAVVAPIVNPRFRDATMWTLHNRVQLWRGTVALIAERPLFGHGWGDKTFQAEFIEHNAVRAEDYPHAHDLPLQLAFGVGVVGLVLYAAMYLLVVRDLWQCWRTGAAAEARLAGVLLLCFAAIAVFSVADMPRGPFHVYLWALWAAGLALTAARGTTASEPRLAAQASFGTPPDGRGSRAAANIAR